MKKTFALISGLGTTLLPLAAFAQADPDPSYINGWIDQASEWLNIALTVIMVLMTFYFLVQVFRYIASDDAKKAERKNAMIRGLVGLFVAVSVWGIVKIAQNVFGTGGVNTVNPTCPPGMVYNTRTDLCN